MANFLNARIRLKYDTYANWQASTVTLLAGEIAIAVPGDKLADVATGTNQSGASVPCLIKVGDGVHKFSELPWLSALAADVHTWAKMSESDFSTWLVSKDGPALATQSQIAELDGRADALEAKVKTLEETTVPGAITRIGNLEERATTLENDMKDAQDDIAAIQTNLGAGGAIGTRVAALETTSAQHTTDIVNINTELDGIDETLAKIQGAATVEGSIAHAVKAEETRALAAEDTLDKKIDGTKGDLETTISNAVATEKTRAESAEAALGTRIDGVSGVANGARDQAAANKAAIDVLNGVVSEENRGDEGKSIRTIANEELAAQLIPEDAAASLDTLTEIAQWIQDHPDDAAAMNAAIQANAEDISALEERVRNVEIKNAEQDTAIQGINDIIGSKDDLATEATTLVGAINEIKDTAATGASDAEANAKKYTDDEIAEVVEAYVTADTGLSARIDGHDTILANLAEDTVQASIDAAEAAAAADATTKANAAQAAAEATAAADATAKANAAQTAAQGYVDGKIEEVNTTLEAQETFNATAITGEINTETDELTLKLNGDNLYIVFDCGSATVNI